MQRDQGIRLGTGATQQRNIQRSRLIRAILPLLAAGGMASAAMAQTVTWDANPSNPAAPTDGSGTWNTTAAANWSNGTIDLAWVNDQTASIGNGGAAGTITIDDPSGSVSAAGINFNPVASGGYVINGTSGLILTGVGA